MLKRVWYGSHHKYPVGFMSLFVAEAAWKYNHGAKPARGMRSWKACLLSRGSLAGHGKQCVAEFDGKHFFQQSTPN